MRTGNKGLLADLASAIDPVEEASAPAARPSRLGVGVLTGRANRLADLASGAVVNHPQELVDPGRCRIWDHHNRDYSALSEDRCADLIESMKAQGKQEVPAIVRRVSSDADYDFEVICGARRHWSVSWLRAHNYPEYRYLVEIRELTDEQAFRISDIENRAREDLSDLERARDYLKAIDLYYGGKQKDMAQRINVSESWLSRYLDLARLPEDVVGAFADPFELKISHIGAIKPMLRDDGTRAAVLAEARRLRARRRAGEGDVPTTVPDVLRALSGIADTDLPAKKPATKKPEKSKRAGTDALLVRNIGGVPILRVDRKDRKGVSVTLLHKGGGSRAEAETAIKELLDHHWPT